MFRIRRFGVIKTANVVAFFCFVVVAIIFVPFVLIVVIASSGSGFAGDAAPPGIFVLGAALLAAVFYGIFGWIFTALACPFYNFAARMIGGIEIQLEAVEPPTPVPAWGSANVPPASTGTTPGTPPAG